MFPCLCREQRFDGTDAGDRGLRRRVSVLRHALKRWTIYLAPYISFYVGLDVTLQGLDMLLRTRFDIHRLRWVKIEE